MAAVTRVRAPDPDTEVEPSIVWCHEHQIDPSADLCGWCGRGYCRDYLVYPFGTRRAPYCLRCALEASGVRRDIRRRRITTRAHRRALAARRAHLRTIEPPEPQGFLHLPPIDDVERRPAA